VQPRADTVEHVVHEAWQASQVFETVLYMPGEQVEQLLALIPVQVRHVEWQQVFSGVLSSAVGKQTVHWVLAGPEHSWQEGSQD
jgi:hypothetical protein